ncbi:MAG: hypothetical protein HY900_18145 [Deltaproteobacteria bacterium]|nr:hypothetical protein [Deltaproteobacteria bacterium]
MFLIGTKSEGPVYVPEHPTLLRFLREAPAGGWRARTLGGDETRVVPQLAHVAQSDWAYFGPARIRWRWKDDGAGVDGLLGAWDRGEIEEYLAERLEKVVLENRCNSAQPPGDELVSVAFVTGLLANLGETEELALREPYGFWGDTLEASTTLPFDSAVSGRSIPALARELVAIARRGLVSRGEPDADGLLQALDRRVDERLSPAEALLCEFRRSGPEGVIRVSRLR